MLSSLSLIALAILAAVAPAAAAGGTIEGRAIYTGTPKRNPLIRMGADPICLTINAGKKVTQELIALHDDGSLGNVFVHLVGDVPYSGGVPAEPVVIEQRGCIYHPRVAGAMAGQNLEVRNEDATLHNIHSRSDHGNDFNVGQPGAGLKYKFKLRQAEVMLKLKCDVHPWMLGFVGVKEHPYFDVTGEEGSFRIEGVPPGTYTIQGWQERLKTVEHVVEVEEGETVTVELAFAPPSS